MKFVKEINGDKLTVEVSVGEKKHKGMAAETEIAIAINGAIISNIGNLNK